MTRILIADDHMLVRDTLCAMLAKQDGFELHAADDFGAACDLTQERGHFELVLLDLVMPGMNGLDGLARMRALPEVSKVAILTGFATAQLTRDALGAGAAGVLPKTLSPGAFVSAVMLMLAGDVYAPAHLLTRPPQVQGGGDGLLTSREREVAAALCRGLSNKEIARELGLQEVTVKLHVKTLCRKLSARNRTHAALLAKEGDHI